MDSLKPTRVTSHIVGDRRIFLKREDENPTGTHKDRRSQEILKEAEGTDDLLVLLTAGNAGYSLGRMAWNTRHRVMSIVDHGMSKYVKDCLSRNSIVRELPLAHKWDTNTIVGNGYQSVRECVRNVTDGYAHAYRRIVRELFVMEKDVIIAPVGSGELFLGLHEGLEQYGGNTELIGVTVAHPKSKADKLTAPWTPYRKIIEEICKEPRRRLHVISEEEVEECVRLIPKDVPMEPSAAVIFAGLPLVKDPYAWIVGINTGKPLYARS